MTEEVKQPVGCAMPTPRDWKKITYAIFDCVRDRQRDVREYLDKETNPFKFIEKRAMIIALADLEDFIYDIIERG